MNFCRDDDDEGDDMIVLTFSLKWQWEHYYVVHSTTRCYMQYLGWMTHPTDEVLGDEKFPHVLGLDETQGR